MIQIVASRTSATAAISLRCSFQTSERKESEKCDGEEDWFCFQNCKIERGLQVEPTMTHR